MSAIVRAPALRLGRTRGGGGGTQKRLQILFSLFFPVPVFIPHLFDNARREEVSIKHVFILDIDWHNETLLQYWATGGV